MPLDLPRRLHIRYEGEPAPSAMADAEIDAAALSDATPARAKVMRRAMPAYSRAVPTQPRLG